MPIKTKNGKWKWGNVERSSKKELVQTVYGIWKKNGSKGSFSDFLKGTHESYEPPYTLDTIKQKYGDNVYRKLRDDPVHRFRAETGIEVIHKEPTRDEFERIVKNWDLMTPEQKKQSDEFSMKQFGNNNKNRIDLLRKEYDFNVGDKVKVRKGLRCFQSGHSGKIIEIEPPDKYGWSSFVIKFDEPRLGAMGFYSGDIEKMNESTLLEDKTSMIKKLILPDIENEQEKEDYKQKLIAFFKSHSNFENKVDWNKFKTLTKKDFDEVINSADKTKGAEKRREKTEIDSDIKNIFKSQKGREFYIAGENDKWLFVAPLNHEAAVFCDSSENQGAGAKWCIGYGENDNYWNRYINDGSFFMMAFNKNYKKLSKNDLYNKLKFMIQQDKYGHYRVWNQSDKDIGSKISLFGKGKKIIDDMFDSIKIEYDKIQTDADEKCEESLKNVKYIEKEIIKQYKKYITEIKIPSNVIGIGKWAFNDCPKLSSIIIPTSVTNIGEWAFFNCPEITNITIPKSIIEIGDFAFNSCEKLSSVIIPDNSISSISNSAFYCCKNLISFKIPDGVVSIGDHAFSECINLKSVIIPNSITSIGNYAFSNCSELKTVYCSEKIWNEFKNIFPNDAERKDKIVNEDKTNMIKKLVLPDIKNEQEKEQFKSNLIEWFKSNSSYETKIDWNKWKTLTKSDFEKLIKSKELSKNQQKHKERKGSGKDAKDLFKNINGRKFKIIDETDNWLFVAPLNYKAAAFCDSNECGGGSAKWCIGYEKSDSFWNEYVGNGEKFIMIFNKNFETMPEKKLFTDLKYMIENDSTEYEVKDQIKIWEQDDRDFSVNYYDSKFEINSEDFKKLFDKIDEKEYVLERFSVSGTTLKDIRPIEFDHLIIPDGIKEVAEYACERDTTIYELTIPSSIENIDQYAFSSVELEDIDIKEDSNLELIGREAFSNNNIETLDLSKLTKLRFIGDKAFSNNRSLKVVYLPISLDDMGYDVFDGCKSLIKLVIPERFFDPENDYEVLRSICGDNIIWDDIEIFTVDENGIKEKRN